MMGMDYLNKRVLKKNIILKNEQGDQAYVYLTNRIFINQYMIKSGLARADKYTDHKLRDKFLKLEKN